MIFFKNSLLFCLFFISITDSYSSISFDEDIKIDKLSKYLEFYVSDENQLMSKLNVDIVYSSKLSSEKVFKALFFSDNSAVENIIVYTGRKKRKVKPVVSSYESAGIFHSDLKVAYFDFNIGSAKIETRLHYEIVYSDPKFISPLYFGDEYEVESEIITIVKPNWLDIMVYEQNFDSLALSSTVTIDEGNEIFEYKMSNIAKMNDELNVPSRAKINPHIIVIPSSYTANGKSIRLMKGVEDLYAWYSTLVDNVKNDETQIQTLVDELTLSKDTDLEKIRSIYYWVQDNIRYIAFEEGIMGFQPESCDNVYNNKYGDCKGMANLTKQMLLIAGYDARLVWLGTRDIPYGYEIPSIMVDNHMICAVNLNDELIYLDATEKYSDITQYAYRIQGQEVLVEDGDSYLLDHIPYDTIGYSMESKRCSVHLDGESMIGEGVVSFSGDHKIDLLHYLFAFKKLKHKTTIENIISNGDKSTQVSIPEDYTIQFRDTSLMFDYEISIENHVIMIDPELYVNLEFENAFSNSDIKKNRKEAYEFSSAKHYRSKTILEIPEGWSVKYLPDSIDEDTKMYRVKVGYSFNGNDLEYFSEFHLKTNLFRPDQFEEWNSLIKRLNDSYSDYAIFEKEK